jgi:hypothetical protein
MTLAATFMALAGIAATFFPQEVLVWHQTEPSRGSVLVVQMAGALYLAFAIMDWMSRGNLMGGIYSRPLALGNFVYFLNIALATGRMAADDPHASAVVAASIHGLFAAAFAYVTFGSGMPRRSAR